MCHEIWSQKDIVYLELPIYQKTLVGQKIMTIWFHNNKAYLRSRYRQTPFKLVEEEKGITAVGGVQPQDVAFYFWTDRGIYRTQVKPIPCGFHISPFTTINKIYLRPFISIGTQTEAIFHIPVVFHRKDVLLFDGRDVSVSQFTIPTPKIFTHILKRIYTLSHSEWKRNLDTEEIMKKYETAYNKILEGIENKGYSSKM